MSKYAYPIDTTQMMSSLKPMPRPQKDTGEKFPKHVVQNASIGKSGITESGEDQSGTKDGQAELEVLKAILNREGYLTRLKAVARTVGKKFKPEVADVLDFVRASTLDVIDMIIRWREVKVRPPTPTTHFTIPVTIFSLFLLHRETTTRRSCGTASTTC